MTFGVELIKALNLVAGIKENKGYSAPVTTDRGFNQRLSYVLSPRTGASPSRVAQLTGLKTDTIRAWQAGRRPSRASQAKLDNVYEKFRSINEKAPRTKKANRVLEAVRGNKIKLGNVDGDERYWAPRHHWPRFVTRWAHGSASGLDEDWDEIVEEWSDSQSPTDEWKSYNILSVDIV